MTWRFFLFVVVAMETSKKFFFLDTGQKQFLTVVFSMSRNWNIFFSFCSRLVECRWTTDDVFYNWNYTFELLAIFLHHFVFWYPIYALIPRLSPVFFFFFFFFYFFTSYPFSPFCFFICCIYALIPRFLPVFFFFFFFLIFVPATPLLHSVIASVAYAFNVFCERTHILGIAFWSLGLHFELVFKTFLD